MHIKQLVCASVGVAMLLLGALCFADYKVGPGDLLRISVFGSPELTSDARVSESGNIGFPLVGQVEVAGRSPAQVEAMLSARLVEGGFLLRPQVSVLIAEYQSQKVSVLGHVAKPGQYSLQMSSRVLDLIATAGGLVNAAAGDIATLVRKDGTKTEIDLLALFGGDASRNAVVQAGDTLYVPAAPQYYIYGEVQKPGVYKLERNMTVSRAISAGGGLTSRGSERRTIIKRRDASGKEISAPVKGSTLLQADDVVRVREALF